MCCNVISRDAPEAFPRALSINWAFTRPIEESAQTLLVDGKSLLSLPGGPGGDGQVSDAAVIVMIF